MESSIKSVLSGGSRLLEDFDAIQSSWCVIVITACEIHLSYRGLDSIGLINKILLFLVESHSV